MHPRSLAAFMATCLSGTAAVAQSTWIVDGNPTLSVSGLSCTVIAQPADLAILAVGFAGPSHPIAAFPGTSWFSLSQGISTVAIGAAPLSFTLTAPAGVSFGGLPIAWLALVGNNTSGFRLTNPTGMVVW